MVRKQSWEKFRSSGMLWWANRILHVFGWAIVVEYSTLPGRKKQQITSVYPARVKYRGFAEEQETIGFKKLAKYMKKNVDILVKEALDE